ncbi:structural protein [Cyanophage S-RIM4]|nr:structural protein [Cyanophage S-RIM4]
MTINKVSQSVKSLTPQFIEDDNPLFSKFIEYYYRSQEKTGYGQNILNQFLSYMDIDKLNVDILDGATKVVESIDASADTIIVENIDSFLENDGTVLIDDEVIYYEKAVASPSVALSPGISYEQVKLKWNILSNPINNFDGVTQRFPLLSQDNPVAPPSAAHLLIKLYGRYLIPDIDFTVEGDDVIFTVAPREKLISDDAVETSVIFYNGFVENTIYTLDNISSQFTSGKKSFSISRGGQSYQPIVDEYVIAYYDGTLLTPKTDYSFDGNLITFSFEPIPGRLLHLFSIEAPIPSFGSGAVGYSRVNDVGQITSIEVSNTGSGYKIEYPPKITINSERGQNASARPLINGIEKVTLLEGGRGYSSTNPPTVSIEDPTEDGAALPKIEAVVENGSVTSLNVINSGSGYTFTPRLTFVQPGGAELRKPTLIAGSVAGPINILNPGQGYTTVPAIYVDEPTGENGIKASLRAVVTDGKITSVEILNAGQGYEIEPRIAVIDPVGAQVLETRVDGNGRVINIELLNGGSGYEDIPSVYIVDNRVDPITGAYAGGSGATAAAAIFNGQITDINVSNFGSGYSADFPPKVVIQSPPKASASAEIGLGKVTGFAIIQSDEGYEKCRLEGCARAASGISGYTEDGNVRFTNNTVAAAHSKDSEVKCLDSLFVKRLLDKFTEQYLPDVPQLDYKSIDVRNAIKNIKTFYSTKGTSFSVAYLFKLLYGENVSISYPRDQIIKPSAATWSINTVLRANLVSGNPVDIQDGLLQQLEDIADANVKPASALVENYISIKTSESEIYELVLSEETIDGNFVVPYKTKLAEPLTETTDIITVDSTIGWPERNGEFIIGGSEVVRYKEKSLNQFIECTRAISGVAQVWDSATEVSSNFRVYINKDTAQEVVMDITGIVDAQQTTLTDTGSYYLPGDKLSISKLGGTSQSPLLTTWLYNVKKLLEVESITFGGVNNQSATVTCASPHGLLVGDQVTVYGANPILYNGTFLVTSRDSTTVFQYRLPQPAAVEPQGNILISVDLNKGKSLNNAIQNTISPYTTNIQNSFFNDNYVYVASTGIPNYNIGPFPGSALLPGNQRKLNRFFQSPTTISTKTQIVPGSMGTWVNGVSMWSYKSTETKTFGAITSISINERGAGYDAANPPRITIEGGGGSGASANVVVDGSLDSVEVTNGGSGYTSSPLVSIVGGGGSGAAATAIITKGQVSRILVNQGGSGYTSQPQITIVGGGGSGAAGTASVRGPIKEVSINVGGASYTSEPKVVLSSGVGAVAQAIVNNGRIISIAIISAGSGYTTAPEVTIQGDGFGAVARATIDIDGENAGKVTGIEIINKGIGYSQGTTVINLTSVGQGATFTANVFKWTYNLQETTEFDSAKGAIFVGLNNQYGGEYAHLSNPQRLRYILGDNLFETSTGLIQEQEDQLEHSPIIGWAYDGNPVYGPYGYEDPTNQGSNIARMRSSYGLKTNLVYDEITNISPSRVDGPSLNDEPAGRFVEDYEYIFNGGDLDQYNGRFCKTPEFPDGRYCYFVTIDASDNGNPVFPYVLGSSYNSVVDQWNLVDSAVQQNIPTGVIRYRDPYENVDIDVERTPNASTNALTLENGDFLTFDVEDENRDGVISQDEIDDPDQIFEEAPLQLFDYFPKVKIDSKVDIEVETISKFENAAVTGFTIENAGQNYQINDRLIFDNTDTDGQGASARVSRIVGESITNYTFETVEGINYGVLTTQQPHNLIAGDNIFVDYTPIMNNTNKEFVVRQYKGIEEIKITQTGSGYNSDIPPTIVVDGDGESGQVEAVVSSVGSISSFNIINSGNGYTRNPRLILSHPQIFKKADYYISLLENNNYVKINDVVVNDAKEVFICGKSTDAQGDTVGFVAKLSATGNKDWQRTLEATAPSPGPTYMEFNKLYVDGNNIWVVGNSRPNISVLDAYNPDVVLAKYTQAGNGLSATIDFQRAYAGISGSTRADVVTSLEKLSDTRFIMGGYTNTNSGSPYDAFLAVVDTSGSFVAKRKLASNNKSEKITSIKKTDNGVYFSIETALSANGVDVNTGIGKVSISTSLISVDWIKEVSNSTYSFLDSSLDADEFGEFYLSATLREKASDTTRDSFWVGKFDADASAIWNYRYLAGNSQISLAQKCKVDIFGNLNVAYTQQDAATDDIFVGNVKIRYDGKIVKHTVNNFDTDGTKENNIEGLVVNSIDVDNSGDVHIFGQTKWNRNEVITAFDGNANDITTHHTIEVVGETNGGAEYANNVLKLFGYVTGDQATWDNSYVKVPAATLGEKFNGDFTIEFLLYKEAANSQTLSQTVQTLIGIGGARDTSGGLWMGYDIASGELQLVISNNTTALTSAGAGLSSTQVTMFANDTWQLIGLKKEGDVFTGYVNGIQVFTGSVSNTSLGGKDLYIGNQIGWGATATDFLATYQGQYYLKNLRVKNRAVTPTTPSDITTIPSNGAFGFAYDWTDDAWFTAYLARYDWIDYVGYGLKVDKDSDAERVGSLGIITNTQIDLSRSVVPPVTGVALTISNVGYALGSAGFQTLDFNDATITYSQDTLTIASTRDVWSSRTATVPSPGSQKVIAEAIVRDRYYFKVTDTLKIDNVQELTINQDFKFTVGAKLTLSTDGGSFINSGYIVDVDSENNKVYLAVNINEWSNDLNTGRLTTSRFDEQETFGIRGPIPNDVNEITNYVFTDVINTTPGTFDIDLNDYNLDRTENPGAGDLDSFAVFKPYDVNDYSIFIEEVAGGSAFIPGSVVSVPSNQVTYNADYNTIQITGLTGVLRITVATNLTKILQATAVANSDLVYVVTDGTHYLSVGENIFVDGNPSQEINSVVYDEYDGSFFVESVISIKEFTYRLPETAVTLPASTASNVSIFIKSPTLKMYYGHQYIFDLSHSSLAGSNLSFSKDSLYKLEYSFNSIERVGTPGVQGGGVTPTVKLKVDRGILTNISYYFDPSRTGEDSPVTEGAYLDVVDSPYVGTFEVTSTSGGTITTGDNTMRFKLVNEPEGDADVAQAKYTTSSEKAVGSIGDIRIVNAGGFYTRLPVVTGILSNRKIERIQINDPGTEYAVGRYDSVPIAGDGEGGLVSIIVEDTTDDEGNTIQGQITSVTVTAAGKGYTTASIDVESIDGILGPGLTGSGADLEVVIPPFGTGASIFTKGTNVGKIKKLQNNNFGYDYTHDYTLRPEITFPINAQLTSTSILANITVTDPGSGYSQAPAVIITGGGGSGATAEATIKNGRLDQIIVKDPGSGYSSTPTVSLRSSFNYVVNLDLGILQFAFPHGIQNGAEVTLNVVDTGDGAEFPLASGALGRLNGNTTYYAIAGAAQSLEDDQLRLAITPTNAELGDAIAFANAGTGRQQVLTESFGATAEANVVTSTFLEGELVYQGATFETATATGYVSTNSGWQVGPRILKIVDYDGEFFEGERITGVISKSSGIISDLNIATGVLEIGPITKTTGQFIDDVGKPSEIIQKIQDSYYYQDFSYAIDSSVSISEWKDIVLKNVHPASFKVFGQLNVSDSGFIPNKELSFELTKSVELAREAIVPNIQNFALVEPIYQEFNNTEVLFRQKRLTSSENILTSVVQRLDDISGLFDGVRISFPLTINGDNVVANANQLMIVLNGVIQTPNVAFEVQSDSIVFSEPPAPPASVKYVNVTVEQIDTFYYVFVNESGFDPRPGDQIVGITTGARATVTKVDPLAVSTTVNGVTTTVNYTRFAAYPTEGTFDLAGNELCTISAVGFSGNLESITAITNNGLFQFGETVRNFDGDTAKVEEINLAKGQETPLAKLRYTVGTSTLNIEVIASDGTLGPIADGVFEVGQNYQLASEIFTVNGITNNNDSTILAVSRAQLGTTAIAHLENTPVYGTDIEITNTLILSKTTGTYQSTPGLYDIQLNDVIIAAGSNVVARVIATSPYQDPTTLEFIPQVNISEGSSFFGFLFNRITSTTYPNIVLDDLSQSQVSIVNYDDNTTAFDNIFPANEIISNYVITTTNQTGNLSENEFIRNYKIDFGSPKTGYDFGPSQPAAIRKLTFKNSVGSGFLSAGQVIRTETSKAEVIGYNQARKTLYLGRLGRSTGTGEDVHKFTFSGNAALSTDQKRFGLTSLYLDGTGDYISETSSSDYALGSSNYTLEAWIRADAAALTGTADIIDMRASASDVAMRLYLVNAQVRFNVNGIDLLNSATTLINNDTWTHVAVVRDGTDIELFVGGVSVGTSTDGGTYAAKPMVIGAAYDNTNEFTGYIDEVRLSNNARYTAAFTPFSGFFQGDANTLLLLHFEGADGQTYADDWSGTATWTNGDEFANDSILATTRSSSATPSGFAGKSFRYLDAADLILANKDFIAAEAVYQLENSSPYAPFSVPNGSQNCIDDVAAILTELAQDLRNGSNSNMWDAAALYVDRTANPITLSHVDGEVDETVWTYNLVATFAKSVINNQTITVTGSHGLTQTVDNTITDSGDDGNGAYTANDCADVKTTIDNLIAILTDTLTNADLGVPVDHLASVTRVTPAYEFQGGSVDAFFEVPFTITQVDNPNEYVYTNQIDADTRYRFFDGANLIRLNRGAIVDKAAYDMLQRYPDLATDMPRNGDGTGSGTTRCKTDLGLILDNLVKDIEVGGNFNTITAIKSYLGANDEIEYIRLQLLQSLYAHTRLGYYMKQAITGDLDDTNTDQIIIGDWGITNDPGGCANVKTAIDTLIDLANDTLAPTGHRFRDGGDLLYFNRDFIADEALGITDAEFQYSLNGVTYNGFQYPDGINGRNRCKVDISLTLDSVISDLLTGGNSNTIKALEYYINASGGIVFVEDELLATVYAYQQVKYLGAKAINNLLVPNPGTLPVGAGEYVRQYATDANGNIIEPYRDTTITDSGDDSDPGYTSGDCVNVVNAFNTLMDILIDGLTPADTEGRASQRLVLFNRNYFSEELTNQVNTQWGAGSWTSEYQTFLDTVVDDVIHDSLITDTSSSNVLTTAVNVDYFIPTGNGFFAVGDAVSCSVNGVVVATATVLEVKSSREMVIGYITGGWTIFNARILGPNVTFFGGAYFTSNGPNNGLSPSYDWIDEVANVQTLSHARTITSTITGQVAGTNLWTNPEQLLNNWSTYYFIPYQDNQFSPDGILNAERYSASNTYQRHWIQRGYTLNPLQTYDTTFVRFDSDVETFDTGALEGTQQFTFSVFVKGFGNYNYGKLQLEVTGTNHAPFTAFFNFNMNDGSIGSLFQDYAITIDDFGMIPSGNDWFRVYMTISIGQGFNTLQVKLFSRNNFGQEVYTGNNYGGISAWGAKLAQGTLDPYLSQNNITYYADEDYNIKSFILDTVDTYIEDALEQTLQEPSPNASFFTYTNSTLGAQYNANTFSRMSRSLIDIIRQQVKLDTYYTNLNNISGTSIPTSTYGTRNIPIPLGGGITQADHFYALSTDSYAEVQNVSGNEARVVKSYTRFRIEGDITDGPFTMNETVQKQGDAGVTGVVYGFFEDENFAYVDIEVTAGTWALLDTIVGDENGTTAQIGAIETRVQVNDLIGDFETNIEWKGYTSGETGETVTFIKAEGAVTDNTGGKLSVDTDSLVGSFETTSVVYPEASRQYIDVIQYAGFDPQLGTIVSSLGYERYQLSYIGNFQTFEVNKRVYRINNGILDPNAYGVIVEVDTQNNYIYVNVISGTISTGNIVGEYGDGTTDLRGYATVAAKVTTTGAGAARIQDVRTIGIYKRLYLTELVGVINKRDAIQGINGFRASIFASGELKARVKRSFRGFDGVQTTFDLTINNGDAYFPDPEGHMLIFVNGILQPPGAANAYTAFSNQIQFTEPPTSGSVFTGFYVGKLRQLDDISFDFDSLRQSFNLKRNGVFYSLTLTEGVQSTTIRPENNIIVSLNGVIQEPGVGFEIVGSRIIFSEIPRVGSTFVAFSYVGSEADVDAAEVVPPIEPGDLLQIDGETEDREVAVIESSNSLITFDYLGSVFGKDAAATAVLTTGVLDKVFVTAPGSGYTSRPNVRIDSISGFDAQIKALVGVGGVVVSSAGSGYQETAIAVETTVDDDWVAPDLSLYGEEVIDPEIIQ